MREEVDRKRFLPLRAFQGLEWPGNELSWLLHPSVWEMGDLIASLLLCFDNRVQNGARIFPPMAVLAILAAKHSPHETYFFH